MRSGLVARRLLPVGILFIVSVLVALSASFDGAQASKSKLKTLYSFCAVTGCADSTAPMPWLLRDGAGNLYGTTYYGDFPGVAYELERGGTGRYKLRTMHTFCDGCSEGSGASGALIIDVKGAVYGVLQVNGPHGAGVVYKLTPARGHTWRFSTVYAFCSQAGCTDGKYPNSGLTYQGADAGVPYDGASPLFGVTSQGGAHNSGTIYKLMPGKKSVTETVIHDFCAKSGCKDGLTPANELALDHNGNIFGVTYLGGTNASGLAYELAQDGSNYTTLYSFCKLTNCTDGGFPNSVPTIDGSGNLIGTTFSGGDHNLGTLFKIAPDGGRSKLTVLYSFCALSNCADGENPSGKIAIDANGDLYGSTPTGGEFGWGILYKLHGGTFSKLFDFCPEDPELQCPKGARPGQVLIGETGHLIGTSSGGGANENGTAFEFSP